MANITIPEKKKSFTWIYDLLFILVLVMAAYFRFTGENWGDLQYQQPDELFLRSVTTAISPVHSIFDYFDTAHSTLNPHNVGQGFYVYGDLPIILVRYLAQYLGKMGSFDLFGRQMSALADLGTIALLYFTVKKIYKPGVALLAATFSSLAVMQIQESHYYTTDNFATFFMFLAIYFAVAILVDRDNPPPEGKSNFFTRLIKDRLFWLTAAFGVAFGMAVGSKLTAAPLAALLPVAFGLRYLRDRRQKKDEEIDPVVVKRPLWDDFLRKYLPFMVAGGIFAILSFRVFQPYAFVGLHLNPKWLANIREVRAQANPNADLGWALQWARRTHLYSFQNLTIWGLGLPLGILAWLGFLWMAWRMIKGEWLQHFLLWSWTAGYFGWQSLQYNPTMRYQLPIYPLLAMMAAWFVFWLWDRGRQSLGRGRLLNALRPLSVILGVAVLLLTAGWAVAFLNIYTHTEPRVAASDWIFQNVAGPINLEIQSADGASTYQQPLPFQAGTVIQESAPFQTAFTPQADGSLAQIYIPYAVTQDTVSTGDLQISIWQNPDDPQPLAVGSLTTTIPIMTGSTSQSVLFDQAPVLNADTTYTLEVEALSDGGVVNICGPIELSYNSADATPFQQTLASIPQCKVSADQPYSTQFTPQATGTLNQIDFAHVDDITHSGLQTVSLTLSADSNNPPEQVLATAAITADFTPTGDARGVPITFKLDRSIALSKDITYYLDIQTTGGSLAFSGATFANETDLDWSLPFRMFGYDPFGGLYRGDLNLQVYWDDNNTKLARFESVLDQSDYIFIPTNHQYAQITRIPERYPLTTVYYRELLGCPEDKDIIWCYEHAEPGMFHGSLGFDLVKTFEDYPTIGPLVINDQSAEEAFTFYDHPKVLVFKKSADYSPAKVQAVLGSVDTSNAIHLTPGQADKYKSLTLPAETLAAQQAGGTWSDLFNRDALYNRYPGLGVVLWYLVILVLGLLAYPLVRAALPGLADHGYPLARVTGLLLWAWFAWLAGSIGLTYSRTTIAVSLALIAIIGAWLAWRQREELQQEIRERWKYYLMVEGLFLAFFLIDLFIRLGNSDLWHPAKGGERPMDFAYLNAILKSTSFPPYDPWYAGGYINYYYYGYVIVGTPVKLLGIVPSIAYNFILPTLFACVGMSAFSVGWNLLAGLRDRKNESQPESDSAGEPLQVAAAPSRFAIFDIPFIGGISASAALILLGNLGVVRMLYQGFQQIAAPGGLVDKANIFQRFIWAVEGFFMTLVGGMHLPYGAGDWYWNPSRALPASSGSPITEFPLFTFIYSDLHAHMIALMVTILAIAWGLSVLLAKARWKNPLNLAVGFFLGGLVIGAIKPTNTWDFYTYLILDTVVLFYAVWRYADISRLHVDVPDWVKRLALVAGAAIVLVGASMLFYQPYTHWYLLDSGYTKVYPWTGGRSDISSYLIHWGVFLFFIVSWMVWETRQWLAETPLSSVRKLKPYRDLIFAAIAIFLVVLVTQQLWVENTTRNQPVPWRGITILWLALPLAAWAGILLLFRPHLSDARRLVMFMVGTGLLLTMVVELIVMGGDIERMNTVFKLYYQAWTLLGLSAAACFGWLIRELRKWLPAWRIGWNVAATALVAGAALFMLMGGMGKIEDRMARNAPHTLDSMTFMDYATYYERNTELDLSADYRAIRWMQDNVKGSPVIAEAPSAGIQYEWLNRFSIYTGLPDVIGWEWHQMQQRVIFSNIVRERGVEEDNFYTTPDIQATLDFIQKYNVRYIIVGELEVAKYVTAVNFSPGATACPVCLAKFKQYDGIYWHAVYKDQDGLTVIYEVNP
jgi:YYY domain-containing protein